MNTSEDFKKGYEEGMKTALKAFFICILNETDQAGVKFIKQIVADYE